MTLLSGAIPQLDCNISLGSLATSASGDVQLETRHCTVCVYDSARQYKCMTCHEKYFLREGQPFPEKLFEDEKDYYKF